MTAAKTLPRAAFALFATFFLTLLLCHSPLARAYELASSGVEQSAVEGVDDNLAPDGELPAVDESVSLPVASADQQDQTDSDVQVVEPEAVEPANDDEAILEEAPSDQGDSAGEDAMPEVRLTAGEALSFVYVDLSEICLGEMQYLVVSLADTEATMPEDATLTLLAPSGELLELAAEDVSGPSALFSLAVDQAGSYELVSLTFVAEDGTICIVDLTSITGEAQSFMAYSEDATGEDISLDECMDVYILEDDGSATEVSSLDEAVAVVSAPQLMATSGSSTVSNLRKVGLTPLVIAIDPGHDHYANGSGDPGAVRYENGEVVDSEARMTWAIANACMNELNAKYPNVTAFLVCKWNEGYLTGVTIRERANRAIAANADVYVSIHINTSSAASAHGCEVWCPSGVVSADEIYQEGSGLGSAILTQLTNLGLTSRGLHYGNPSNQPNDSLGDYFGNIRYTRAAGIPGIIVEHAFLSNDHDYTTYLKSSSSLRAVGRADAAGIANYYGLYSPTESDLALVYDYNYYIANNPDVASAYGSDRTAVFQHFLQYGIREGRQAISSFNPTSYKNEYADLRALFGDNTYCYYVHWSLYGKNEGRHGTGCNSVKDWQDTTAMHRLYNRWTGEHFYTGDVGERNQLIAAGWKYEGTGWYAPNISGTPVYRVYNRYSGDHHYTTSATEAANLVAAGWTDEGIGWYSAEAQTAVAVYRQYNPYAKTGTHNFTTSKSENDTLVSKGWKAEGIAFYATRAGSANDDGGSPVPTGLTSVVDPNGQTPIMGAPMVTQAALLRDFNAGLAASGRSYPSSVYSSRGAATAAQFISALWNAAISEGVRPEVLYAQMVIETGYLRFGGQVSASQCNFGGLGADDGGAGGATFSTVSEGLTAQAQHLRLYAQTATTLTPLVDTRHFSYLAGTAPYVESLGNGKWASDPNYASKLITVMNGLS